MASTTQEEALEVMQWVVSRGPWECGLFIGHPGFGQDLSLEVENTASTNYTRQVYTFSTPELGVDLTNDNILEFDDMPSVKVTHWGLFIQGDATLRYVGTLVDPITVEEGESIRALSGSLVFKVS